MNITYDKKKWLRIIVLLVIAILSFSAGAKYAAAPEHHKETIAALDEKKRYGVGTDGGSYRYIGIDHADSR